MNLSDRQLKQLVYSLKKLDKDNKNLEHKIDDDVQAVVLTFWTKPNLKQPVRIYFGYLDQVVKTAKLSDRVMEILKNVNQTVNS